MSDEKDEAPERLNWFMQVVHFLLKPTNAIEYGLMKYRIWICPCANCKAGVEVNTSE